MMMSFLHNYNNVNNVNCNTVGTGVQIPFQFCHICYGQQICVDKMDYYLPLPPSLINTGILSHQKKRLQQFPGGKQLNSTCVCYKLFKNIVA